MTDNFFGQSVNDPLRQNLRVNTAYGLKIILKNLELALIHFIAGCIQCHIKKFDDLKNC